MTVTLISPLAVILNLFQDLFTTKSNYLTSKFLLTKLLILNSKFLIFLTSTLMKVLPLILAPNPILKKVSQPVETIDDALRQFMRDMVSTMYSEHGVGLAAVQVGVLQRVLVIDVDYEIEDHHHHHDHHGCGGIHVANTNPRFFINPEIIESSEDCVPYNEGCLSFPEMRSEVIRPESVKVKFLDENGKEVVEEMEGLLATCIQHEIDHLNGITFVDHISKIKRDMILNKMKKLYKR